MLTLGSLFDGIGTWQLAAINVGIQPLWSSEIEEFPRKVTAHHFPNSIQLGDINQITDTARYKALGNGMALPIAEFILRRIKEATE